MPITFLLAMLGCLFGAGCGGGRLAVQQGPEGSTAMVRGDWADVEAAAIVGVGQAELAILDTAISDSEMRFQLRTLGGEAGELVAVRAGEHHPGQPGPIRLNARVGTFGDREAESRLLARVAARLRRLAGVDWAPL